jgi:hypothetical protein
MGTSAPLLGEPLPVELMNTIWADRDGVHDALSETAGTEAWLRAIAPRIGLPAAPGNGVPAAAGIDHLTQRLRTLRDALRRLAAEATGDPRPAAASTIGKLDAAVAAVNQAAGAVPRWSALAWTPGETPSRLTRTSGRAAEASLGHRRGGDRPVQPGRPATAPGMPCPRMRPVLPQGPPPSRMVLPRLRQPGPRCPPLPAPPQPNGLTGHLSDRIWVTHSACLGL